MQILILIILLVFLPITSASETIHIPGPQKKPDASHDYFVSLLRMTLEKANNTSTLTINPHGAGEGRLLRMLAFSDLYDVVWTGVSKERDELLHRIPIPLFKGGLGLRGLVIRKDSRDTFKAISNIGQLSNYIACQGRHWPDAVILKNAGLPVQLVSKFDAMFQMLELRRCDYLSLSIFEGSAEFDIVKDRFPLLIYTESLIISYPLTINFYVKKSNSKLAKDIEVGLLKLIKSGEFEKFMKVHNLTKNGFPLERLNNATIIELKNNNISQDTLDELANYGFEWLHHKMLQKTAH